MTCVDYQHATSVLVSTTVSLHIIWWLGQIECATVSEEHDSCCTTGKSADQPDLSLSHGNQIYG